MAGEDDGESRLPGFVKGLVVVVAFIGMSALFAMLMRPLASPRQPAPTIAIPPPLAAAKGASPLPAPTGQAAIASPSLVAGPKVAILVTEIGDDMALGERAIEKLPLAIGLAFLPGRPISRPLAAKARADGHETWIGLPMQPKSWPRVSPGANTLLVGDPPTENVKRVEWALEQIDRPVGAYTMMGSAFTANATAMQPVAAALNRHKVVLLDARSTGATVAADTVRKAGGRALSNNLFIDADPRPTAINAALDQLARQAKARGQAVGIARALPVTLAALPGWADGLAERGVTLVPPSSLAQ